MYRHTPGVLPSSRNAGRVARVSVFKKLAVQGGVLVARDENERVVAAHPVPAEGKSIAQKKETWRTAMRRLTNDGLDQMTVLHNLSQGIAYKVTLPDGRESEPIIPTPEVRRAAAIDLLHMLHGKPVAQTEVVRAEQEAEDAAQYASFSDEQLEQALIESGWRKAKEKRLALQGGEE